MLIGYHIFSVSKMKFFHVYWIFVLISSASNGIIFLKASGERIPGPIKHRGGTEVIDNVTLQNVNENAKDLFIKVKTSTSKIQLNLNDETESRQYFNEKKDFESIKSAFKIETKSLITPIENFTHQPNLSQEYRLLYEKLEKLKTKNKMMSQKMIGVDCLQLSKNPTSLKIGDLKLFIYAMAIYLTVASIFWCIPACLYHRISETGQAAMLTLVDTASLELQNLAEPHFSSDDYFQISPSNLSQATSFLSLNNDNKINTDLSGSKLPFTSVINLTTVNLNETKVQGSQEFAENSSVNQDDSVITVKAEQKTIESSASKSTNSRDFQTNKETHKNDDNIIKTKSEFSSASGELDQETAKAKLISGSSEESATVISNDFIGSGSSEPNEDIPSFSEWAQKRLEEAEKKKTHPNASLQNPSIPNKSISGMKVRSKNYASPDCGAKIVAVNPEARSARNVLVSTRDEYMLNTCTSKIWFVVELCEAIQAKKIELANFELFSSSPKDFSVFVSDRFPTREWSPAGQFAAKDAKDIQSFTLYPHLFGKFIKLELHSHYGSEHFCPISLFRTYGISEFEVLETETEIQEPVENEDNDDDDQVLDSDGDDDASKNLFGSARDAVIRIVKKAAEVLVQSSDLGSNNMTQIQKTIENNEQSSHKNCMTLKYMILCNNCTDYQFAKVFRLLSCRSYYLDSFLKMSFFSQTFYQSELCKMHGFDLTSKITKNVRSISRKKLNKKANSINNLSMSFIISIFSTEYIIAFCNAYAAKDRILDINSSSNAHEKLTKLTVTPSTIITSSESSHNLHKIFTTCSSDNIKCKDTESSSSESKISSQDSSIQEYSLTSRAQTSKIFNSMKKIKISETIASQIKPTKTLNRENIKRESSIPVLEPSKDSTKEIIQADVVTTPSPLVNSVISTSRISDEPLLFGMATESMIQMTTPQMSNVKCEVKTNTESITVKNDREGLSQDLKNSIKAEEKEEKLKDKDNEDIKLNPQDQLSLDALLYDLKDLENDTPTHGSAAPIVAHSATSTPQQKESVFLRLSNRIKTLERNMSLSSQYLEELSRRYKKQVEELQRSLERATIVMSEEFKKNEERELKRLEEIAVLREIVSSLSQSVEILMYDKNNWRGKLSTFGQHIALIFIEIIIFILIILYCRRSSDLNLNTKNNSTVCKEILRRKSAESPINNVFKRKTRRPSEIASRIAGTYQELMIDEKSELKKERRNRRNKDFILFNSNLPDTKSDLMSDCTRWLNQFSIEHENDVSVNNRTTIEDITSIIPPELSVNERRSSTDYINSYKGSAKNNTSRSIRIFKNTKLPSPSFMKTALYTRSNREKLKNNEAQNAHQILDNWEWYSRTSDSSRSEQDSPLNLNVFLDPINANSHNGDIINPNEYNKINENVTSENPIQKSVKKVKKEGSLKKMVKKLF